MGQNKVEAIQDNVRGCLGQILTIAFILVNRAGNSGKLN
jgi:hypothetical protein